MGQAAWLWQLWLRFCLVVFVVSLSSWANNAASPSFSPSSLASTSASPSSASTPSSMARYAERRPSLLGDSLSKSEYTVVNIGGPENPRLITCIKTSQGSTGTRTSSFHPTSTTTLQTSSTDPIP